MFYLSTYCISLVKGIASRTGLFGGTRRWNSCLRSSRCAVHLARDAFDLQGMGTCATT
ncbi:hypothetical protein BC941DRAFT_160668 [Chlamydoabsidia padenii]|nr:hypothetical protein BC941DRAFT_160668 [Chlamydoabsidia padenii]